MPQISRNYHLSILENVQIVEAEKVTALASLRKSRLAGSTPPGHEMFLPTMLFTGIRGLLDLLNMRCFYVTFQGVVS